MDQASSGALTLKVSYQCHCHCGATALTIQHAPLKPTAPHPTPVISRNCSICPKNGYLLIYIPRNEVEYTRGWDKLSKYRFASKTRDHLFCGTRGKSTGIDYLGNHPKGDLIGIMLVWRKTKGTCSGYAPLLLGQTDCSGIE